MRPCPSGSGLGSSIGPATLSPRILQSRSRVGRMGMTAENVLANDSIESPLSPNESRCLARNRADGRPHAPPGITSKASASRRGSRRALRASAPVGRRRGRLRDLRLWPARGRHATLSWSCDVARALASSPRRRPVRRARTVPDGTPRWRPVAWAVRSWTIGPASGSRCISAGCRRPGGCWRSATSPRP